MDIRGEIKDYTVPPLLWSFLKWVLIGPLTEIQNSGRREKLDVLVGKVTQLVYQYVKTNRQVNYDQQDKNYNKIETPLSIGTSLFLYRNTRSKKLVDFISDLNIGVNYDKVISIKKDIASSIPKQNDKNNCAFIPTGFVPGKTTFFAIDNGDVKIDTPDGKQLHGTVVAAYQEKQSTMNSETTVNQYAVFTNLILHTIVLYQTT